MDIHEKQTMYDDIARSLAALFEGERLAMPNLANAAAVLGQTLPNINWVGFYLALGGELVLSSFWGKPACIRIPFGRGVCGTAATTAKTQLINNVHEFDGHIACDECSNSELVVPIVQNGRVVGVLDADSPHFARFDVDDARGFERLCAIIAAACDFPEC